MTIDATSTDLKIGYKATIKYKLTSISGHSITDTLDVTVVAAD